MKTLKLLGLVFMSFLALGLFSSCSDDDENDSSSGKTTGTAVATIDGKSTKVNWVQLWEDGPKFAEFNVGATSVGEVGAYYTWGGFTECDSYGTDYNRGNVDLEGDYDTATMLWGSNWRMPSKIEYQALMVKCDVSWSDNYNNTGLAGFVFQGREKYANNKVFFPEKGKGAWSNYWCSTVYNEYNGYYLYLEKEMYDGEIYADMGEINRADYQYVRAVCK